MSHNSSTPNDGRDALFEAHLISMVTTLKVPGDIPSLLKHAYSRHFHENIPSIEDPESNETPADDNQLESLISLLDNLPPLNGEAQVLLDRARSILTDGPPLSMNVELAEGQELPVAMHTLLQGTLWAAFMACGADPDLGRTERQAKKNKLDYSQADKCLWFLCKKTFFAHQIALKDGKAVGFEYRRSHAHRLYAGRLFELVPAAGINVFARVPAPPASAVFGMGDRTILLNTPRGVFGLERRGERVIHFNAADDESPMTAPARLGFEHCPKIAQYEAKLPPWHKHELLTTAYLYDGMLLLTPAGMASAGWLSQYTVGPMTDPHFDTIYPVPLPDGFIPDSIMAGCHTMVVSMGNRQMIAGPNGGFMMGTEQGAVFNNLEHRVDRVLPGGSTTLFLSGRRLLAMGPVEPVIISAGLLPGFLPNQGCRVPTALQFKSPVCRIYCTYELLVVGYSGKTSITLEIVGQEGQARTVRTRMVRFDIVAVARVLPHGTPALFCQTKAGQWIKVNMSSPDAKHVRVKSVEGRTRQIEALSCIKVDATA
ncbi:hypothetical protein J8273_0100 [Carpediemonas membranifera]|uniref:Uncharacterized protein n=1 Tax=Carpediemonas membranifera TaxID=201153 RepID=A0A8J6B3F3_9EUKA|nr:hypothetical protein J8273_0100 [Carpediemonas membranifera]|eukprot:KAG9394893.1 hypothetical protein J8273_0100 [Carpediemonas membranifera]